MYRTRNSYLFYQKMNEMLPGGTHSNFHARNNDITLCMKQGRGSRIWDIDDNEYLDLFGKYGACILGHHHAELDESLHRAVDHITVTELAETTYKVCQLLKEWFPHGDMIRMGLSGNEVIQNAFRLARGYTGKQKIIRFIGHFHGTADDVLGGWNHSIDTVDRSKLENQAFETEGRRENSFQSVIILPWNNVKLLEETMQRYSNSIAAIIMEPVMCNGGGILADNTFFAKVRKLCSENNVVFILDELITGIRSGPGGFQKEAGIVPDLTIVGKSIANGVLPLSCIIGKKEIMNLYTEGRVVFGGTYNGYQLAMATAQATLEILNKNKDKYFNNLKYRSEQICAYIIDEAKRQGVELTVQGHFSSPSFHMINEKLTDYDQWTADLMNRDGVLRMCLQANGILTASISRLNMNVILNDSDIEFFMDKTKKALSDAKLILRRKK